MKQSHVFRSILVWLAFSAVSAYAADTYQMSPGASYSNVGGQYSLSLNGLWDRNYGPITDRYGELRETYTSASGTTRSLTYDVDYNETKRILNQIKNGTYSYRLKTCYEYYYSSVQCNQLSWSTTVYVNGVVEPEPEPDPDPVISTIPFSAGSVNFAESSTFELTFSISLWPIAGPIVDRDGVIHETAIPNSGSHYTRTYDIDPDTSTAKLIRNKPSGTYVYRLERCNYYTRSRHKDCTSPGLQTVVIVP